MTQPPQLDAEARARIEAEEAYRAQLRAGQPAPVAAAAPPKRAGCGRIFLIGIGVVVVLGIIGSFLPKSSTDSGTVSSSDSSSASQSAANRTPTTEGDGSVQADGSQNVGVWNIGSVSWRQARNVGGEYGTNADDGEKFVIVNYRLKNTTNDTQTYNSMIDQPQLITSDGGTIDADTMLSIENKDQLIDGQIAPSLSRVGGYVFRVPDAMNSGMKFQIQFVGGQRVVFALK